MLANANNLKIEFNTTAIADLVVIITTGIPIITKKDGIIKRATIQTAIALFSTTITSNNNSHIRKIISASTSGHIPKITTELI